MIKLAMSVKLYIFCPLLFCGGRQRNRVDGFPLLGSRAGRLQSGPNCDGGVVEKSRRRTMEPPSKINRIVVGNTLRTSVKN